MSDLGWEEIMRMLNRPSNRRKTSKAADYVPGGTTMLRSLDHLPLEHRTPHMQDARLHTSEHMTKPQEDKARRWIQRPNHDYEATAQWSNHAYLKSSTGSWLHGDDGHFSTYRRPSLTPTYSSGGYYRKKSQSQSQSHGQPRLTVQPRT